MDGEEVIKGIEAGFGGAATIFGGMAGDDLSFTGPKAFTHGKNSITGLAGLIIDGDKIDITGVATCGWKPIGTPKTVTRSEGNWVYTIDDEPALDVLLRFTGAKVDMNESDDLLMQIGTFPLQVSGNEGSPVMKPPLMFNKETGAVLCGGRIPEGAKIRFSLPPEFDIVETVIDSARDLKKQVLPEADALLVFSCIGRQMSLGPLIDEEINGLNEVWNVPMIGYFSLGEFGATKGGKSTFQGTTCSWVALKEK